MKVLKCLHDTGHEKSSGGVIKTSSVQKKKKKKKNRERDVWRKKDISVSIFCEFALYPNLKIQREITASIIEKVLMTPKLVRPLENELSQHCVFNAVRDM